MTQTVLDFAQKTPGTFTCPVCHLAFNTTLKEDTETHARFHREYLLPPRLNAAKNDLTRIETHRGVTYFLASESSWDTLETLRRRAADDFPDQTPRAQSPGRTLLAVIDGRVIGVLVAAPPTAADTAVLCDVETREETERERRPAVTCRVVVESLWVHEAHRRQGVATRLLTLLPKWYRYGELVQAQDVAARHPPEAALALLRRHFAPLRVVA